MIDVTAESKLMGLDISRNPSTKTVGIQIGDYVHYQDSNGDVVKEAYGYVSKKWAHYTRIDVRTCDKASKDVLKRYKYQIVVPNSKVEVV